MIKRKVFYGNIESGYKDREEFDDSVDEFIKENLTDCAIIKYDTKISEYDGELREIRTEIIYIETPTRKILTEKQKI